MFQSNYDFVPTTLTTPSVSKPNNFISNYIQNMDEGACLILTALMYAVSSLHTISLFAQAYFHFSIVHPADTMQFAPFKEIVGNVRNMF